MKRPWAAVAVSCLLSASTAWGMDEEDWALKFFEDEAAIITATKSKRRIQHVPANAYVVTAEDIARYGYRTIGEALQSVPGFYTVTDRNYSYLWVRGFGRPGDYNSRILVLLNGHRLNENVYGSFFVGHDFSLDLRAVERIEVVKGPGSALYGDNAFFAVVNVMTRPPGEAPSAQVSAEAGGFGMHKEFLGLSRRFAEGGGAYAAGSYRLMNGEGLRSPEFATVNGGLAVDADREESYTFFGQVLRPGWMLQGNLNNRNKRIPTASYGTRFNDNGTFTGDSRGFLEASGEREVGPRIDLKARLYYDWYQYRANYVYDQAAPPPQKLVNKDLGQGQWFGEETTARFTPWGEDNALLLGQEYEKNIQGRQRNHDEDPFNLVLDDDHREYRWALFAQQELKVHRIFELAAGLRFDRYKSFGNSINPRLGLIAHPYGHSTLKLLYGSAFRAPVPYELYYAGPTFLGNQGLRPEEIRTFEAVLERKLWMRGFFSFSYFQNHIRNLISQVTDVPSGKLQFINKDRVRTDGIEAGFKGDLNRSLSGHLGYTLQSTREAGGDRLSNSPTHSGALGLSGRLPAGVTASAELFALSGRRTTRNSELPGACLLSLNVTAKPWARGPGFYAGVYNVADVDYRASASGEHVQHSIPQGGRSFTVGFEQRFGVRE